MPRTRKTEPTKTKDNKAHAPSIRGEKRIGETDASIPIAPGRRKRGTHDGPTDPAAVDKRREFTGTDDPVDRKSGKGAARPRGGNAGRGAVGLPGKMS
jgi:hypothetical protein